MKRLEKLRLTVKSKDSNIAFADFTEVYDVEVTIGKSNCSININSPKVAAIQGVFGMKEKGILFFYVRKGGVVYFNRGRRWIRANEGSKVELNKGNRLGFLGPGIEPVGEIDDVTVEVSIVEIITENVPQLVLRWGTFGARVGEMQRQGFDRDLEIKVGAVGGNDIILDDGHVSGKHGMFKVEGSVWYYYDLSSTMGSWIYQGGHWHQVAGKIQVFKDTRIVFLGEGRRPVFKIEVETFNG